MIRLAKKERLKALDDGPLISDRRRWGLRGRPVRNVAFSLVELLVVVAIIGVLAAALMPAFKRLEASGQESVCTGNLRQIIAGWQLYCGDHNGNSFLYRWENIPSIRQPYWMGQVIPYLNEDGRRKVLLCPTAMTASSQGGIGSSTKAWTELYAGQVFESSYGLNAYWYSDLAKAYPDDPDVKDAIGNITRATFTTPVFADSAWVDNQWSAPVPSDFEQGVRWVIARHRNKGINMAFSDGSVRFASIGEYYRDYRMYADDVVPHLDRYEQVPAQYR